MQATDICPWVLCDAQHHIFLSYLASDILDISNYLLLVPLFCIPTTRCYYRIV